MRRRTGTWLACRVTLTALLVLAAASLAVAEERYAIIVAGASGGAGYAQQYGGWTKALSQTLIDRLGFDPTRVTTLSDTPDASAAATAENLRRVVAERRSQLKPDDLLLLFLIGHGTTAENLRRVVAERRSQLKPDDLLLLFLIGHGTFDGVDAKFNLVGPDLEAAEWATLLRGMPGRLVIVNGAPASSPFVERLAGPRRIVISATDSVVQRFDTVFPEYFIAAFREEDADIDKNGRTSLWEAFAWAAGAVRRFYQERGQLATERPLLDDNGDGVGREASAQGLDGMVASRTYLAPAPAGATPTDELLVELLHRRASLVAEVEELQVKKAFMSPDEYAREFERIMLALARVGREIRQRNAS